MLLALGGIESFELVNARRVIVLVQTDCDRPKQLPRRRNIAKAHFWINFHPRMFDHVGLVFFLYYPLIIGPDNLFRNEFNLVKLIIRWSMNSWWFYQRASRGKSQWDRYAMNEPSNLQLFSSAATPRGTKIVISWNLEKNSFFLLHFFYVGPVSFLGPVDSAGLTIEINKIK